MKSSVKHIALLLFLPFMAQPQGTEYFDSPNVIDLVNNLPFEALYPVAQEIRYTYSSVLELKKKKFEPYLVTDEHADYFDVSKNGISGQVLQDQYNAFQVQGRDWIKTNEGQWSAGELDGYSSFQRSMEGSMSAMHTYYSIMGSLSSLSYAWTKKEAQTLVDWTADVTNCRGASAPNGSVLHLNMMRLTKGERFRFHSSNDFVVTATLENGDSTILISTQVMQMWVNTSSNKVAPEDAVPIFQKTSNEDKLEILKPASINGFTPRFALLINAAVKDLYSKLDREEEK